MNRLATLPTTLNPPSAPVSSPISLPLDDFSSFDGLVDAPARPASRPAVFCPLHYEQGYAYPLVVWLHDRGENEHVLRKIVPRVSLRNYVAVAPRGVAQNATLCDGGGYAWPQGPDDVELADERVLESIQFVRGELHTSKKRVFLAGQGEGGTMALRLALAHPQRFAGAISIDGLLPRDGLPMAQLNELRQLPMLLSFRVHETLNLQQLREDERLLHSAGMPYSIAMSPDHASALPQMLADLDRWMMSVVCPKNVG